MYGYIYKTTNLVNNKIYIGQKKSDKFLEEAYLGSGVRLRSAIQHYGLQNFKVDLIEKCTTKEELDEREKFWIKKYNTRDLLIGYNIAPGGQASCWNKGKHLSKEHKRKISESEKGKKHTNEAKEKMRKAKQNISYETRKKMSLAKQREHHPNYGKQLSEETKEKIRKSKENMSAEYREKLSAAHKGKPSSIKGKIAITDGYTVKYIFKNELNNYISLGYRLGKK